MKRKISSISILFISLIFVFTSCERINTDSAYIEGLNINNYPIIDGSTSTLPLNRVIACDLLGLKYEWKEEKESWSRSTWSIEPKIKGKLRKDFDKLILSSQTHNSIINLIDHKVDITLSARSMSPDEKAYAETKGVTLIETPIALDAFIFIVNPDNPVESLTTENIQDIYTGKKTKWTDFGIVTSPNYPEYSDIYPFVRNPNSGSQELMDLLVMKDLEYLDLPIYEENLIFTMAGLLDVIGGEANAIGYTVHFYNEFIIRPRKDYLKTIGIDGVQPTLKNIANRSYPYTTEVYAVIRSDTDKSSMTYKVHEWLQTEQGKKTISNSGYIPN